jgi:septal ring factor EnvC (AmiA/AmiB activator)
MNSKILSAVLFFCMTSLQSFAQDQKSMLAELNKLNNEIMAQSNENSVLNKLLALQTLQNKYKKNHMPISFSHN